MTDKLDSWPKVLKHYTSLADNKGKSLKEILPQAAAHWKQLKKTGQVAVASASKVVKSVKVGGADKVSEDVANSNSSAAAAFAAASMMPRSRGRGKTKTRAGGKGKNGRSRTRRVAGKNKSKSRGKSRSRSRAGKGRAKKSGKFDITSTNLK